MSDLINVARIVDGIVVNIEVADQNWINANTTSSVIFVPVNDSPVSPGMSWDSESGFGVAPLVSPSQESLDWAAANGDTSWEDLLQERNQTL